MVQLGALESGSVGGRTEYYAGWRSRRKFARAHLVSDMAPGAGGGCDLLSARTATQKFGSPQRCILHTVCTFAEGEAPGYVPRVKHLGMSPSFSRTNSKEEEVKLTFASMISHHDGRVRHLRPDCGLPRHTPPHTAAAMWRKDEDIMGDRRGAHKDGEQICAQYVFKKPGGTNPDGTTLWGACLHRLPFSHAVVTFDAPRRLE